MNRMNNKSIWMGWIILLLQLQAAAQQEISPEIKKTLSKTFQQYQVTGDLSFQMQYRFAKEQTPGFYEDSLFGQFHLQGNRYWYRIDSTEMIKNDQYVIIVFREDHLIYLAQPTAQKQPNPLTFLDSTLWAHVQSASITMNKDEKQIQLLFKEGLPYKTITYFIQAKTGWITKVACVAKGELFYDNSVKDKLEGTGYAVFEIRMNQYSTEPAANTLFDEGNYFRKEGKQYYPSSLFSQYQIFIGSPTL
jgi:hypothetical protein